MKRTLTVSTLSICLSLVVTTAYLLAMPTSAFAAYGEAECEFGEKATCQAYVCSCEDNNGCVGFNFNGDIVSFDPCDVEREIQ